MYMNVHIYWHYSTQSVKEKSVKLIIIFDPNGTL